MLYPSGYHVLVTSCSGAAASAPSDGYLSSHSAYFGGTRFKKHDGRVDAYGEVDEANAWLGLARASAIDADLDAEIVHLQRDLFALGAQLADPADKIAGRVTKAALGDADVVRLEQLIDRLDAELPPLRRFILAGRT